MEIDTGLDFQMSISATDGDYLPLVAIAPQYPTRAAQEESRVGASEFTVDGLEMC